MLGGLSSKMPVGLDAPCKLTGGGGSRRSGTAATSVTATLDRYRRPEECLTGIKSKEA
jgi:hypothetical protein